jgi:hypothetical protein
LLGGPLLTVFSGSVDDRCDARGVGAREDLEMKRAGLILAVAAAVLAAGVWQAAPTEANNKWSGYHWERAANPFAVELIDSVSGDWDGALGAVSADWTASSVLDMPLASALLDGTCDPVVGQVRACNGEYGQNGWLGLATISILDSHIQWGTAQVNDSYFNTATYDDANAKQHVLCQEVGHTLGLGHDKKNASCMNDRFGLFSASYVSPSGHDYDMLAKIHSHLDGSGGGDDGGGGGKPPWAGGPGGRSGQGAANALPPGAGPRDGDVFERHLSDGSTLITFVTWIDGPGGRR